MQLGDLVLDLQLLMLDRCQFLIAGRSVGNRICKAGFEGLVLCLQCFEVGLGRHGHSLADYITKQNMAQSDSGFVLRQ